jgi:hypothetical protein
VIEKIGPVRNPLTIIAIFAGIAEISGTVVLPFISDSNQSIYMWFLMLFPAALILLFFATLNFNHKALYAPSDFSDEDNFFRSLQRASTYEIDVKKQEEISEQDAEPKVQAAGATVAPVPRVDAEELHRRYEHLVDAALLKLESELGQTIQRGIKLGIGSPNYVFDGVILAPDRVTAIELQYFRNVKSISRRMREAMPEIISAAESLPDSLRARFSLILVLLTDASGVELPNLRNEARAALGVTPFTVDLRVISTKALEDEFGAA